MRLRARNPVTRRSTATDTANIFMTNDMDGGRRILAKFNKLETENADLRNQIAALKAESDSLKIQIMVVALKKMFKLK